MDGLQQRIAEAAAAVRSRWSTPVRAGVILGTGMARIADQMSSEAIIPYAEIPHFPRTAALGHRGRLVCGTIADAPVLVMDGRPHVYEGHPLSGITLPVRVMHALGAQLLLVSNASGGIHPDLCRGDLVVVEDHINLMWDSPFAGSPDPFGKLTPSGVVQPYDPGLIDRALSIARQEGIVARRGVYVAMTGPNYETPAEYRFLGRIGGDVVGMSTVPEAVVGARCGLRVLAISVVANVARPDAPERTDAHDVLAAASNAVAKVATIVSRILASPAGL